MQKMDEEKLEEFKWIFDETTQGATEAKDAYIPPYGDITELNSCRLIMDSVGKETLQEIGEYAISLLDTSVAVYEINGDYAFGMFSSGWCRIMDAASWELCKTADNKEALSCGMWLCHENCWNDSAKTAIETGKSTDIDCVGGIHLYAEPIYAGQAVVGAINIGYGDPPKNPKQLKDLADQFGSDPQTLKELSDSYLPRPQYIVQMAKKFLKALAGLIGRIVEKSQAEKTAIEAEEALRESEAKYKRVSDNSPAVLYQFLMSPSGEVSFPYVSDIVESIFGVSPEEVMKDPSKLLDMVHPEDQEMFNEGVMRAAETLESFPLEFRCTKNGEVIWIEARWVPTPLTDGGILWDGFLLEVTDRKKTEEELKRNKESLDATGRMAKVGGWEFDAETSEIRWTKETLRIHEVPLDYKPNLDKVIEFFHPDDRQILLKSFQGALDEGRPYDMEVRFTTAKGKQLWTRTNCEPVIVDGKVVKLKGTFQDITDRKQALEEVKSAKAFMDTVLDLSPFAMWIADQEGTVTRTNHCLRKTLNLADEMIVGKYNVLKDANLENQGVMPLVKSVFDGNEVVRFSIPWKADEAGEADFQGAKDVHIDVSIFPILNDVGELINVVCQWVDITDLKKAEDSLRESEEKYRLLVEKADEAIFIAQDDIIKFPNPKTLELIGYSEKELATIPFADLIHPEDRQMVLERYRGRLNGESPPSDYAFRIINKANAVLWIQNNVSRTTWDGRPATINLLRDISEKRQLEEQLRQSQKMEAIGNLAGGIAHEFNNVLAIILGNAELAMDDVPDWNPASDSLKEIRNASFRGKNVVRQILSFARKTMTALKPLEINTIVKESLKLMRASIPAMIDIQPNIPPEPSMIMGDPTEIHQIVINLCTNAFHAMKETGGILEVGISEVTLDNRSASRYEGLTAGDFVKLTVKDTGEGVSPEILEKVFEPYFTTKEFGAGSGMGLAVVYGIVKKCKGAIYIESTVGEGTTVKVLFPKIEAEAPAKIAKKEKLPGGNERILLVDDDPSIVAMIRQMLEKLGYHVTDLTDSMATLEQFKSTPDDFDLVITDMSMPKMSGDRLAAELIKVRKDIPILLCTGHSDTIDEKKAKGIEIKGFAMKPLDMGKLARAVRTVLDDS